MPEKIYKKNVAEEARDYSRLFGANKNLYRTIPSFIDGLKPGKRRTLWAWWDNLHRPTTAKNLEFIKVTNISAYALFYHPHGNTSIELSLTSEGQSWNNNAMLIVPQGSYGSIRGDEPSAGRYIEAKPSEYMIDCFFSDFSKYCVPMRKSYDGKRWEPDFLPAKYPHALFNPQFSAIGYGLASNIPSFNVAEVLEATIQLIRNPNADVFLIPDIPSRADVIDDGSFEEINRTGNGNLTMRASATIDHINNIIQITSLPHQSSAEQVIRAILAYRKKGKLLEIVDIKDYTKNDTVDMRFILRSDANPDDVLAKLYKKKTGLRTVFPVSMTLIDDFKVVEYGVRDYLKEWIEWRRDVVLSMFNKEYQQVTERIHLNEVLLFVFGKGRANETLKICRMSTSKRDTIKRLMDRYEADIAMTSLQAETIANMRLHQFNQESYAAFQAEKDALSKRLAEITAILNEPKKLDAVIIKQLQEGIKKYGRPRCSRVITDNVTKVVPNTKHMVGITETGFIKKVDLKDTSVIGQVGKHKDNTFVVHVKNKEDIIVIDSDGQAICIPVSTLPSVGVDDIGVELSRYFKTTGNIIAVMQLPDKKILKEENNSVCISLFTAKGLSKRIKLSELNRIHEPRSIITLNEGDTVVSAIFTVEDSPYDVIVYTTKGEGVRRNINDIRIAGRGAKGNRCIKLEDGELVANVTKINPEKPLLFYVTSKGRVKLTETKYFPVCDKGTDKVRIIDTDANEDLVYIASVDYNESVEIYYFHSEPSTYRWEKSDVALRVAPPQKKIRIPRGDRIVSVKVCPK